MVMLLDFLMVSFISFLSCNGLFLAVALIVD